MNFNYLFLWIVGVSALSTVIRGMNAYRKQDRLLATESSIWVIIALTLLLTMWGLIFLIPDWAGIVTAALWLLFIVIPGFSFRRVHSLLAAQKTTEAYRYALLAFALHPFSYFRSLPLLVKGYDLQRRGELERAAEHFERLGHDSHPLVRNLAQAQAYVCRDDWRGLCSWYENCATQGLSEAADGARVLYLRGLGETGRLDRLVSEFIRFDQALRSTRNLTVLRKVQLICFSFLGQPVFTQHLLATSSSALPDEMKSYWLALALASVGELERAKRLLESINHESLPLVGYRAQAKLKELSSLRVSLQPDTERVWRRYCVFAEKELLSEARSFDDMSSPRTSYLLIALNAVVFGIELWCGGSDNIDVLISLGALYPPAVYELGQWWRIIAAGFLHAGIAHLLTNMLGVYILGPFVEEKLGHFRFFILFVGASVVSFSALVALSYFGLQTPGLVVGASAGVMGLVGASASLLAFDWIRDRSPHTIERLKSIAIIIAIQVVFDLSTPQVSFSGHLGGLIAGSLLAAVLTLTRKAK